MNHYYNNYYFSVLLLFLSRPLTKQLPLYMAYTLIHHPKCQNIINISQLWFTLSGKIATFHTFSTCHIKLCYVLLWRSCHFQSILPLHMALNKQVSKLSSLPLVVKINFERHQHQHLLWKLSATYNKIPQLFTLTKI